MVSAKEAREKTEISIAAQNAEELLAIEEQINNAIKEGKTFIHLDDIITEGSIVSFLKKLDYRVEICSGHGDCWTKISW